MEVSVKMKQPLESRKGFSRNFHIRGVKEIRRSISSLVKTTTTDMVRD
jgi:hypothetical protein